MAAYLACQSVARVGVFPHQIWHNTSFIPTCVKSRSLPVNKGRWRNHVTGLRWARYSRSQSSASRDGSYSQWRVQQGDDSAGKRSSSSWVTQDLEDDGSTRQQRDSVAATSSKTSKATDDWPSRFHVKKSSKTDSSRSPLFTQSWAWSQRSPSWI